MSAALATIADRIAPIGLPELNARAALQTRVDSKYVLDLDRFDALVAMLVEELQILQIDGAQEQTYDTMYFDTVGLGCFRDHLQRRRQTYKLRTRVYVGSGLHVFEVKMRDGRGHTVKVKIDHRDCHPHVIGPAATAFYRESIRDWYGFDVPDTFVPSLRNQYDRITWVSRTGAERTTIDHSLRFLDPTSDEIAGRMGTDLVLIETKSATGSGDVDRALWQLGVRPRRVSKYCIGVGLLHPPLQPNRYLRALATAFAAERAVTTTPLGGPRPGPPGRLHRPCPSNPCPVDRDLPTLSGRRDPGGSSGWGKEPAGKPAAG